MIVVLNMRYHEVTARGVAHILQFACIMYIIMNEVEDETPLMMCLHPYIRNAYISSTYNWYMYISTSADTFIYKNNVSFKPNADFDITI